jgi:hypothetical protein
MTSVGESFSWPFQDAQWTSKILIQGLIALIPIIGWIALVGWLVMTIDNYRVGRRELPPAGFHLERGIVLFLVYVVYAIVFSIPGDIISGAGLRGDSAGLSSLGNLIGIAASLLLAFLMPSVVLHTYRSGFNGGLDISGIWEMATRNTTNSVIAGVLLWVSGLIGGLGLLICCIGFIFTAPYGAAIAAGVVIWYEQVTGGGAPATSQAPLAPQPPPPPPPAAVS